MRHARRSLAQSQSPRLDVGYYFDLAFKKCFYSIPSTNKGKYWFYIDFSYCNRICHTNKLIILLMKKKVMLCITNMLDEGNTYHEVVAFCKINGGSSRTLAAVIHQHVPIHLWP